MASNNSNNNNNNSSSSSSSDGSSSSINFINGDHMLLRIRRRRSNRQYLAEYLQRMEQSMPWPMPMSFSLSIPMGAPPGGHWGMDRRGHGAAASRFGYHMMRMANEHGQAGDVGNIGDSNQVVGIPTVTPPNHMAHMGGGDAEYMYNAPLETTPPHMRGAGDGGDQLQFDELAEFESQLPQRAIQPARRETLQQRRERSVQQILRIFDFIQQQLATISEQIDAYERKLAQHSSPSPPEPDGDVI